MRRISPPKPQLKLYESGFSQNDQLGRSGLARRMTQLLDILDEPVVVALDGGWGEGKSFFLQCWTGAHKHEFQGQSELIYFDAFAKDYLQDPLVGLVEALSTRLSDKDRSGSVSKIRSAVAKLAKPAMRVSLSAATAGITEITGPVLDAILKKATDDVSDGLNELWESEDSRTKAIEEFRNGLEHLTETVSGKRNLIFIVDELDRCRPDYAIELLEIIKHFFEIPNVHFVLGVNLSELEESVKVRYGRGSNARAYLSKHISLKVHLPSHVASAQGRNELAVRKYFKSQASAMDLDKEFSELVLSIAFLMSEEMSFRDANDILSNIGLIPFRDNLPKQFHLGYRYSLAFLVVLKLWHPNLYQQVLTGSPDLAAMRNTVVTATRENTAEENRIWTTLSNCLDAFCTADHRRNETYRGLFDFGEAPGVEAFQRLAGDFLETFKDFEQT